MIGIITVLIYLFILALAYNSIAYNVSLVKLSKRKTVFVAIINYLLIMMIYFSNNIMLVPIMSLLSIGIFGLMFRNLFWGVILVVFSNLIFAVSDACVSIFMMVVFHKNYEYFVKISGANLVIGFSILIISIFISATLKRILKKAEIDVDFLLDNFNNSFLVVLYEIMGCATIYSDMLVQQAHYNNISNFKNFAYFVISTGFFLLTLIIIYFNSRQIEYKNQKVSAQKEFEQLKIYTEELESISNELRGFKHDCSNIMLTLRSFVDEENVDGLKEYFYKELLPESKGILRDNKSLSSLQHIKIIPIKGLISSKHFLAEKLGIKFNIEVIEDIYKIHMKLFDLSRIVGILIDNAIEEANECEEKYVSVGFYMEKDGVILVVKNICRECITSENIYKKGFSTKGEGRGIGLSNLRDILEERYPNALISTTIVDNVFTQELAIYERLEAC